MEIIDGSFDLVDGGSLYIPPKFLFQGWGTSVSAHVVGPDFKALPEAMWIKFYSYFEDTFYEASFELPAERIAALFAREYRTRRSVETGYDRFGVITAGVAPGGSVAVWLIGAGRTTEVFFGQAKEVELDWHQEMRMPADIDRSEVREGSIKQAAGFNPLVLVRRQNLDLTLWARYRDRYDIRYAFEGFNVPEVIEVHSLNGEKEDIFFPQDEESRTARRAAPRFITFPMAERRIKLNLEFAEEPTMALFKRMAQDNHAPVEMLFRRELVDNHPMFGVYLRTQHETVELTDMKMKVWGI